MNGLFGLFSDYYYVVLILQAVCVFHAIRHGNQGKWIWIIVFLPVIGCVAYLFTEVINKREVSAIQSGVTKLVNPGARIKALERNYQFTNTFANRVALADAYLQKGMNNEAIELYEQSLTGLFEQNEHVIEQLILAYYNVGRYEDVNRISVKISGKITFTKSKANILYALALENSGHLANAEKEFRNMNLRFSNYEARYNFVLFLLRNDKEDDAMNLLEVIADEAAHLSRKEKGESKIWIDKALAQRSRIMA